MTLKQYKEQYEYLKKVEKDLQCRGELDKAHKIYFQRMKLMADNPEFEHTIK